jgi:hypothetical protein
MRGKDMVDEIVETPEEKAIRLKKGYTEKAKDEYIVAQLAINPDFVFDEGQWKDRPIWSDEITQGAPKNVPPKHMLSIFPSGSVVPYVVAAALVAIILLIVLF